MRAISEFAPSHVVRLWHPGFDLTMDVAAVALYTSAWTASNPGAFPIDSWSKANLNYIVTGGSSIS